MVIRIRREGSTAAWKTKRMRGVRSGHGSSIEEQLYYIRPVRGSVANFSVGRSRERDGRETATSWSARALPRCRNHEWRTCDLADGTIRRFVTHDRATFSRETRIHFVEDRPTVPISFVPPSKPALMSTNTGDRCQRMDASRRHRWFTTVERIPRFVRSNDDHRNIPADILASFLRRWI